MAINTKQEELKKQGLQDKEIANLAVNRRKNKGLKVLKTMGGPFTPADAVDEYVASENNDNTRLSRLYVEVRYTSDTLLSLPKTSDLLHIIEGPQKAPNQNLCSKPETVLEQHHFQCRSNTGGLQPGDGHTSEQGN